METEKTILEQISQKELELKGEFDIICEKTEANIHEARLKAREFIDSAEKEGRLLAEEYLEKEMKALKLKINEIKDKGIEEAKIVQTKGRSNLSKATERLKILLIG